MTTLIFSSFLFGLSIFSAVWVTANLIQNKKMINERLHQIKRNVSSRGGNSKSIEESSVFFNRELKQRRQERIKSLTFVASTFPLSALFYTLDPKEPVLKFLGAFFVILILKRLTAVRQERLKRAVMEEELPPVLDLLMICVEAGMSINAALVRVASEIKSSALAYEFRMTFHELNAGVPLQEAFYHLGDRSKVPDLQTLATSIIQSEKLGLSLGETLRNQSRLLRETIRTRTREKIMKIPILLLLPLVFCIFPALFVVIGGPAAIQIAEHFISNNPPAAS